MDANSFYREFDKHPGDRIRLFGALAEFLPADAVMYPGSYVDVAPSVFFGDVTYVDMDKRAARFFSQEADVRKLINEMRSESGVDGAFDLRFIHSDYSHDLSVEPGSVDLLVSLYAGFVSEHCSRYLKRGGHLFANNSHGDVSMADLDPSYELVAVMKSSEGNYRIVTDDLEAFLNPTREQPTVESLHASGRGVAFEKKAFAYLLRRG